MAAAWSADTNLAPDRVSVLPGESKKTRHTGGLDMEVGVGLTLKYQMLHIH